jgi:hypothetical protein
MSVTEEVASQQSPERTAQPARQNEVIRTVGSWSAYLFLSWLVLYPILTTAIVADDFINPWSQYANTGFNPRELIQSAWDSAGSVGHFNYVGQIIGVLTLSTWMFLMSEVGLRYSTVYAATKFVMFVLCAVAASAFLRAALDALGRKVSPWRCRITVSALLFGTLQLHHAWSNDPVGSYPLSGFAAAALGFAVLTVAIRAVMSGRTVAIWATAALATLALLYYEMNASLVVALAIVVLWGMLRVDGRERWRAALRTSPMVLLPAFTTIALQFRAAPDSANYEGTSVSLNGTLVRTYLENVASSLPGSGWKLTGDYLNRPVGLQFQPLAVLAIVATLLIWLARRRPQVVDPAPRPRRPAAAVILLVPLAYWLGSTLLQSATAKVQNETHGIGYVYNFYAVGVTAIAVIVAGLLVVAPLDRVPAVLRIAAGVGLGLFLVVQSLVTANIADRLNEQTIPNQKLLIAYSEQLPVEQRCEALRNWTNGAWPDYYELSMIEGLDVAYRKFHGEAFCPGFRR